jgi:hypothetical protein
MTRINSIEELNQFILNNQLSKNDIQELLKNNFESMGK